MTYSKNQVRYLEDQEMQVWTAIRDLTAAGRTGNTSQIARATRLSGHSVQRVTRELYARGYLRDIGRGAAHHWRVTSKVPQTETAERAEYELGVAMREGS